MTQDRHADDEKPDAERGREPRVVRPVRRRGGSRPPQPNVERAVPDPPETR